MSLDRRLKNAVWHVRDPGGPVTWDGAQLAVLMDIRDELQGIRRRLDCPETLEIPRILRAIQKNTTKRRRAKRRRSM